MSDDFDDLVLRDGVVEGAPHWGRVPAIDLVVRLFKGHKPVRVLASYTLDADLARVTCCRRDTRDFVGAGIFTATISRRVELPLEYGVGGVWDDEEAAAVMQGSRVSRHNCPRIAAGRLCPYPHADDVEQDDEPPEDDGTVLAVLPAGTDGHVAHSALEALSTRWPTLTLRGRDDGTVEVRVVDATVAGPAKRRVV